MHRILEELALSLVLLLDVGVDVTILRLLILNEIEEALIDSNLQLLMIIRILNDLVDSILEVVDVSLIVPNDVSIGLDRFLDHTLSQSEIFDHVT